MLTTRSPRSGTCRSTGSLIDSRTGREQHLLRRRRRAGWRPAVTGPTATGVVSERIGEAEPDRGPPAGQADTCLPDRGVSESGDRRRRRMLLGRSGRWPSWCSERREPARVAAEWPAAAIESQRRRRTPLTTPPSRCRRGIARRGRSVHQQAPVGLKSAAATADRVAAGVAGHGVAADLALGSAHDLCRRGVVGDRVCRRGCCRLPSVSVSPLRPAGRRRRCCRASCCCGKCSRSRARPVRPSSDPPAGCSRCPRQCSPSSSPSRPHTRCPRCCDRVVVDPVVPAPVRLCRRARRSAPAAPARSP